MVDGDAFDLRKPSPAYVFDSYADSLRTHLAERGPIDYAIVDLGRGDAWLTTRLYLFAVLLERMRDLRAFVFIYTSDDGHHQQYLGIARAVDVRWALARAYPYLEETWASVYAGQLDRASRETNEPKEKGPIDKQGRVEPHRATWMPQDFLSALQKTVTRKPRGTPWVELDAPEGGSWERAAWLRMGDVRELLDGTLVTSAIVEDDHSDINRQEQLRQVLEHRGDFVAIVRNGDFVRLIDRHDVIERMAHRAAMEPQP